MKGHLGYMQTAGFDVLAVSSPGTELEAVAKREGVRTVAIQIEREIRLAADFMTLYRLISLFRKERPRIVNAGTPKAGLLGMLAAWVTRVPVRIYTLRGLRLETKSGIGAFVLYLTECLAGFAATSIIPVSRSLRAEHRIRRIAGSNKSILVGEGSSNGVDWARFSATDRGDQATLALPSGEVIDGNTPTLGFVGRIVQDKGVDELIASFQLIREKVPDALLVIVGSFESGDAVSIETRHAIERDDHVVVTGYVEDTSQYYPLFDVLLFPSHREGFPNVPLEAACAQVPTVGFNVTGTKDAIVHGETGYLVPKGSAQGLADHAVDYLRDPKVRREHGRQASHRAKSVFGQEHLWSALARLYREQLGARGHS